MAAIYAAFGISRYAQGHSVHHLGTVLMGALLEGLPALLTEMDGILQSGRERLELRLPAGRGDLIARLHRSGTVLREEYEDGHVEVTALVPPKLAGQVRKALNGTTNGRPAS